MIHAVLQWCRVINRHESWKNTDRLLGTTSRGFSQQKMGGTSQVFAPRCFLTPKEHKTVSFSAGNPHSRPGNCTTLPSLTTAEGVSIRWRPWWQPGHWPWWYHRGWTRRLKMVAYRRTSILSLLGDRNRHVVCKQISPLHLTTSWWMRSIIPSSKAVADANGLLLTKIG